MAGTDANFYISNHVGACWPACRSMEPADTAAVKVLRFMDGTGVVHGTPDLATVLDQVDEIISLLARGISVIICCINGAHRSATLTTLTVMRATDMNAKEAEGYVSSLRNIVDLSSRAPATATRINTVRPIDFLSELVDRELVVPEDFLVGKRREIVVASRHANELMSPALLRRRALEFGFVAGSKKQKLATQLTPVPPPAPFRFSAIRRKPRAKAMPLSVRGRGSQDAAAGLSDVGATDTTESYEVVASEDEFETDGGQGFTDTDGGYEMVNALGFDVNPDSPPETPRANWTAEDFSRLQQVMTDLRSLNQQMLAFTATDPGGEAEPVDDDEPEEVPSRSRESTQSQEAPVNVDSPSPGDTTEATSHMAASPTGFCSQTLALVA